MARYAALPCTVRTCAICLTDGAMIGMPRYGFMVPSSAWLLRGSVLAALGQVLTRLDVEQRAAIHRSWKEGQLQRPLVQLPPVIQGVLPHPDRPYPRGLRLETLRRPRGSRARRSP